MANAQIDPLAGEGKTLAKHLRAAGIPVTQTTYSGVTHEFFGMGAVVATAKTATGAAVVDLKSALATD